jgi:hypothetical protein
MCLAEFGCFANKNAEHWFGDKNFEPIINHVPQKTGTLD